MMMIYVCRHSPESAEGVLSIDTALDGVSLHLDIFLRHSQVLSLGNANLFFDQVNSADHFCDWMFNLVSRPKERRERDGGKNKRQCDLGRLERINHTGHMVYYSILHFHFVVLPEYGYSSP